MKYDINMFFKRVATFLWKCQGILIDRKKRDVSEKIHNNMITDPFNDLLQ